MLRLQMGTGDSSQSAIALYTFLKEFTQLRSKIVRSTDQYEDVLWFADVPREPECDCAVWHRAEDYDDEDVWLEIRQPQLHRPPRVPESLQPWLDPIQVADSSLELLELRDEIAVAVSTEYGANETERRRLEDYPEVKATWEAYVEEKWWPWAGADRRAQAVQRVYTQLFSIHQKQQRLGEQFEVVLGLGALTWRTPDGQDVKRHLIAAQATVRFDAARGAMSVGPAGEGAQVQFEQDMLDPQLRPDPDLLRSLENELVDVDDRLWSPSRIDNLLSEWVHAVSPKGLYGDSLEVGDTRADPEVRIAPALILRKRTERSFLKAFEEIVRQLKDGATVPEGVTRFVSVADRSGSLEDTDQKQPGNSLNELYFPLESNEAQRRIVDRLSTHQGVLVQGPPGTGKSHTIVNLVCHLLATGQRVLVTSHTARALKVLQRYIAKYTADVSPLAVVLLGDDRKAIQAMEDSVQGITTRQNHWDDEANSRLIREHEAALDQARRDEARVMAELRQIRERETYVHPPRFGPYGGTLSAIATRLHSERQRLGWLSERPDEQQSPPLSAEEFRSLLTLLRDVTLDKWQSTGWSPVRIARLPSADAITAVVSREKQAHEKFASSELERDHPDYKMLSAAPLEAPKKLVEQLRDLLKETGHLRNHFHDWTDSAVLEILGDHDRAWRDLLESTNDYLSRVKPRARWADETPTLWPSDRDRQEVLIDAQAVLTHLEARGSWGFGPFRAEPVRRRLYLRREVTVGGHSCETSERLKDLIEWLEIDRQMHLLHERWAAIHRVTSSSFSAQVSDFEDLCEPLAAALALRERVECLKEVIRSIEGLREPAWHDLNSLKKLLSAGEAVACELEVQAVNEAIKDAEHLISREVDAPSADPTAQRLLTSLRERRTSEYREVLDELAANGRIAALLETRGRLLETLRSGGAGDLAEDIVGSYELDSWESRVSDFEAAWNWARATASIERLCDPETEQQLRLQMDSARERIRSRLKDIAAGKAWAHCFARMTEHERQHLVAWSKAVRSIGKGTGKYASQHRRNAREHMNECRTAIPAWVMPLYRVAETIKPGSDLFDVVIIDEASQSGPEALLLAYLAKKILVVGDDKQISPTYAGINHEDVNQLRARYISHLPHADAYGVQQSFFDLAEIRYQGRIRLREHFRCMPEIIQFSNNLCYASEPLIPLRQYGADRLSPTVSAHFVEGGYLAGRGQKIGNPPEASAIVDQILSLIQEKAYEGKTIGVISLLGSTQAKMIEAALLEKLGPEEMERRQLVCGDAYAFQGDERDVMFLSLVSAVSDDRQIRALTDEASRRRFNVAASRARDQMMLFHSVTTNDLSPNCLRHELLRYCLHPSVERGEVGGLSLTELQRLASIADRGRVRAPEPFESWFELDVFIRLASRDYRVLPQYELGGYRIDLVVEGMESRIAVECDGDHWHGAEQYEQDTARQRDLERCGLKFCRIRESAFRLDPEDALEEVWTTLEREQVYPAGHVPEEPSPPKSPPEDFPEEPSSPKDQLSGIAGPRVEKPENRSLTVGKTELLDAPYVSWSCSEPFPDPADTRPGKLVQGLGSV